MKISNYEIREDAVLVEMSCSDEMWIEMATNKFVAFIPFDFQKSYKNILDEKVLRVLEKVKKYYEKNPNSDNLIRLVNNNIRGLELVAKIEIKLETLKEIYRLKSNLKNLEWKEFCGWISAVCFEK